LAGYSRLVIKAPKQYLSDYWINNARAYSCC